MRFFQLHLTRRQRLHDVIIISGVQFHNGPVQIRQWLWERRQATTTGKVQFTMRRCNRRMAVDCRARNIRKYKNASRFFFGPDFELTFIQSLRTIIVELLHIPLNCVLAFGFVREWERKNGDYRACLNNVKRKMRPSGPNLCEMDIDTQLILTGLYLCIIISHM